MVTHNPELTGERMNEVNEASPVNKVSDVERVVMRKPVFGEWMRGIYASERNPHRDGMYVRTIRRTGRMNPGAFYELTDGKGAFWQYPKDSAVFIADA